MKKILVVVDMQKDFIDGVLGSEQAQAIVQPVVERIEEFKKDHEAYCIICTLDKHYDEMQLTTGDQIASFENSGRNDYESSREGKHLPVPHCVYGTEGYELHSDVANASRWIRSYLLPKQSFGSREMYEVLFMNEYLGLNNDVKRTEEYQFEFVGLCTDLCVLANVITVQSFCPNSEIYLNTKCCAGSTVEMHNKAIEIMRNMHINIIE